MPVSSGMIVGLWERVVKLHSERKIDQGCQVSSVRDMASYTLAENLGRKWENGYRVPNDLTVAPVQVDVITVVRCSKYEALQVFSCNW